MKYFNFVFFVIICSLSVSINITRADDHKSGCDKTCIDTLQKTIQIQQQQLELQQKMLEQLEQKVNGLSIQVDAQSESLNDSPQIVKSGNKNVNLSLSGQVNRGVLYADDGDDSEIYHVDNDNSSTRIRLIGEASPNEAFTIGSQIEVQFESNSTASINQNEQSTGPNKFTERKLEFYLDSPKFGKLWIGQGDTASNNASEVDLSGTTVIGYSGVADLAGGILFRDKNSGQLKESTIGSTFSNLDGLSRDDRVRYDTPSFNGFKFSTSATSDSRWDAALRYAGKFGPAKASAALAYSEPKDGRDNRVSGSFSILFDNGINFTLAAGQDDRDDRDPEFWYANVGYQTDLFSIGTTAFTLDYYSGEDIETRGDESDAYGLFAVQNLAKYNTQFYLGVRNYELDSTQFEVDDIFAILAGARIKF